jgi:hypothetical protein
VWQGLYEGQLGVYYEEAMGIGRGFDYCSVYGQLDCRVYDYTN